MKHQISSIATSEYISPNDMFDHCSPQKTTAFGYLDGKLFHHTGALGQFVFATHSDIFKRREVQKLFRDLKEKGKIPYQFEDRKIFHVFGLLGRIGTPDEDPNMQIISFWNQNPRSFSVHLADCLQEMHRSNLISSSDLVISTPLWTKRMDSGNPEETKQEIIDANETKRDPEAVRKARTYAQEKEVGHIQTGEKRKRTLKAMGVGFKDPGPGGTHPWGKSLTKKELLVPGGKWWAPHSESFLKRIDSALL